MLTLSPLPSLLLSPSFDMVTDLYTQSRCLFEEYQQSLSALRSSGDLTSIYGDVGRLIEEVELILHELHPFLSHVTPREDDIGYLYGLLPIPFPIFNTYPLSPTHLRLPAAVEAVSYACYRSATLAYYDAAPVLLERLRNTLLAGNFVSRNAPLPRWRWRKEEKEREKEKEKERAGKERALQSPSDAAEAFRKISDMRFFLNLQREPWIKPLLLSEASLLASTFGLLELSEWFWGHASLIADKEYDLYSLAVASLSSSLSCLPFASMVDNTNAFQQGMTYAAQCAKQKSDAAYPIHLTKLCLFGRLGTALSFLVHGRVRKTLQSLSAPPSSVSPLLTSDSGSCGGYELLWMRIHCLLLKQTCDAFPKVPNLDPLFNSLKRYRAEGHSLSDRFAFASSLAKYFAITENCGASFQAINDCVTLIKEGGARFGSILHFLMLTNAIDAVFTLFKLSRLQRSSLPSATSALLSSSLSLLLEVASSFIPLADVYRIRIQFYESKLALLKAEGKEKKTLKTLGRLAEQAEKGDLFYELFVLYQEIMDYVPSDKERDPLVKLCGQLGRSCGLFYDESDTETMGKAGEGGEKEKEKEKERERESDSLTAGPLASLAVQLTENLGE